MSSLFSTTAQDASSVSMDEESAVSVKAEVEAMVASTFEAALAEAEVEEIVASIFEAALAEAEAEAIVASIFEAALAEAEGEAIVASIPDIEPENVEGQREEGVEDTKVTPGGSYFWVLTIVTAILILINCQWYTTSDPTICVVFPGLPADTGSFAYYLLARGVVYGCVLAVIVATLTYRNTFKQQPDGPLRSPHERNFRLLVGLSVFASMAVTLHAMNSALRKFEIGTNSIQCALINATPFVLGLLSAIGAHTLLIEIDPHRYVELADPDEESGRSRSATVAPAKFSDYCCTKLQRATLSMSVLLAVLLVFGQQFEPPIGMAEHASNFTLADRQAAFQRSVSIDF